MPHCVGNTRKHWHPVAGPAKGTHQAAQRRMRKAAMQAAKPKAKQVAFTWLVQDSSE
jgi:hypothetical protein